MLSWVFTNQRTSAVFTSSVLSASYDFGRATYMDTYSGGGLTITIKNQNTEASAFRMNDVIILTCTGSTFDQRFWVDEIQYNDYQGNTGLSTATIICSDAFTRLGRKLVNKSLSQLYCVEQAPELNTYPDLPSIIGYGTNQLGSIASAAIFSGAPLTRLNQLVSTNRGIVRATQEYVLFYDRNYVNNDVFTTSIKFGRTTASNTIAYQSFTRTALGQNFMNTVTVTPTGGAEQVATNSSSVSTYGSAYYSVQSEDYTNAQGFQLSSWLANSQSDPNAVRFDVEFDDRTQDNAILKSWLNKIKEPSSYELTYLVPGTISGITTRVVMEGYRVNMTPTKTDFSVSFSPLAYYEFFTLNSTSAGVLDSSRLGW